MFVFLTVAWDFCSLIPGSSSLVRQNGTCEPEFFSLSAYKNTPTLIVKLSYLSNKHSKGKTYFNIFIQYFSYKNIQYMLQSVILQIILGFKTTQKTFAFYYQRFPFCFLLFNLDWYCPVTVFFKYNSALRNWNFLCWVFRKYANLMQQF